MSAEWPSQKPKIPIGLQEAYDALMTNSGDELKGFITSLDDGWYEIIIEMRLTGEKTRYEHVAAGNLESIFKEFGTSQEFARTLAYLPDVKLDELISYMDPALKAKYGWKN